MGDIISDVETISNMKWKRIPFGNFYMHGGELCITMKVIPGRTDNVELYAELPDPVFGFKSCTIDHDTMVIKEREGFTDHELAFIIDIIRNNHAFIRELAKEGKVYAVV